VSLSDEALAEVRTEETGPAGHENASNGHRWEGIGLGRREPMKDRPWFRGELRVGCLRSE
jgi:hypothetical protein